MISPRKRQTSLAATWSIALFYAEVALAAQGPGVGPGTASHFTQVLMAIIVYGACALVVCAGLIGGLRKH